MEALETDEEVVLALIGEALEGSEEVTVEEASATVVEAAVEEEVMDEGEEVVVEAGALVMTCLVKV